MTSIVLQKPKSGQNGGYAFDSPTKKPTVCGRTPVRRTQLRPREARARQQALLLPMNATALLCVKAEVGKLRHTCVLTTDQSQLLHRVVTDEAFWA